MNEQTNTGGTASRRSPVGAALGGVIGALVLAVIGGNLVGTAGAVLGLLIGGGLGAYIARAVADSNVTKREENYWREQHASQPYAQAGKFEHFAPAYRTGFQAARRYTGRRFEEIEEDLAIEYERNRAASPLPWEQARPAVRAAWDRLGGVLSPRDPDRGMRSGL